MAVKRTVWKSPFFEEGQEKWEEVRERNLEYLLVTIVPHLMREHHLPITMIITEHIEFLHHHFRAEIKSGDMRNSKKDVRAIFGFAKTPESEISPSMQDIYTDTKRWMEWYKNPIGIPPTDTAELIDRIIAHSSPLEPILGSRAPNLS